MSPEQFDETLDDLLEPLPAPEAEQEPLATALRLLATCADWIKRAEGLLPPRISLLKEIHAFLEEQATQDIRRELRRPTPWPEDLAVSVPAGDSRVLLNGHPPLVPVRVLSEENYQIARAAVNALAQK